MKRVLIVLSLFFVLLSFLSAQESKEESGKKKGTEVKQEKKVESSDVNKELDEGKGKQPVDKGSSLYVYDPKGRRDPFVDLLRGASAKGKREFKEGVAGLNIDELELEGIIRKGNIPYAQFKGPDNKSYLVRAGVEVYDGRLTRINPKSVVFVKTYQLGASAEEGNKIKIIKRLNPEEEESGK